MKLIDVLNRTYSTSYIAIKHVLGIGDSQHYLYIGYVADLRLNKECSFLDREVHKIYVNESILIIVIE